MGKNCIQEKTAAKPYRDTIEQIEESKTSRHFFAASNSKNGFVSYFDEIFGGKSIERLYLLGGGPGSGKSTMLKQVAALSEKNGYLTERIHCSSSPYSLDGVMIAEKKLAVIDATAPHTYAPQLAGVREICVDPGRAWDLSALSSRREAIARLSERKKKQYRRAYIYLRAASLVDAEMREMARPFVLEEKLLKNAAGAASGAVGTAKNKAGGEFSPSVRLQRAVSAKGSVYFESFSAMAEKTVLVHDFRGTAAIWFDALFREARRRQAAVTVSYDPENPEQIDGMYFHETGTAFTMYASRFDKIVNCGRFLDKKAFSDCRGKYRFAEKSRAALLDEAYDALARAGTLHDEIEAEYGPCTDYTVTQKLSDDLCDAIFG